MKTKLKNSWKPLLFLFISAVIAGVLFNGGWINERILVAVGLGGFIIIIILVAVANTIIKRNSDRINKIYETKQQTEQV